MNLTCIQKLFPCTVNLPCVEPHLNKGIVFNIQRYTVHDGPGIRTEIFLKGCPLRCNWCSNPESFALHRQVGVYPSKCIGQDICGACIKACTNGAIVSSDNFTTAIDRNKCNNCMKCYLACPTGALKEWGQEMSVAQVMKIIKADREFYDKSGGGVTISGGESLLQWEFTKGILEQCKLEGIHTCVETALHIQPEILGNILPLVDLLITDIKHMDTLLHKKYTQVGNELILSNIRHISEIDIPLILRLPIIPNINDSQQHIDLVSEYINSLKNKPLQVQFLRFRRLGEEKYASLGIPYKMSEVDTERESFEKEIKLLVEQMNKQGIPAYAGTTHKILHTERNNDYETH